MHTAFTTRQSRALVQSHTGLNKGQYANTGPAGGAGGTQDEEQNKTKHKKWTKEEQAREEQAAQEEQERQEQAEQADDRRSPGSVFLPNAIGEYT